LASVIAWRSEPVPESLEFVTMNGELGGTCANAPGAPTQASAATSARKGKDDGEWRRCVVRMRDLPACFFRGDGDAGTSP
jgi:hypothetical protein